MTFYNKNLIVYSTGRSKTSTIMMRFAGGVQSSGTAWSAHFRSIESFLKDGFTRGTDAIACLGILRGTGMAMQEAAKQGIDRYYLDHAYFDGGYGNKGWMRISKNRHTMNYLRDVPKDRYKTFFQNHVVLKPWRTRPNRGNKILILPPTHAVQWYFNAYTWCDDIVAKLKEILPPEYHQYIKVRIKPNEPIVDKAGNLVRLEKHLDLEDVPLEQDLDESNIVIAYNSNVALQAMLIGLPVICNKHCSVYPVSFTLEDLKFGPDSPALDVEPKDRYNLVKWLSYTQFKRKEIENGRAWKLIQEYQDGN